MDWKEYENEIFEHFQGEFPDAKLTKDAKIVGRFSKVERQIDLLIDGEIAGFPLRVVVDAKHWNKPIDVSDVEGFLGFCSDVGASKGVLISPRGFTPAAANRAHFDESDIELDVLNYDELKTFQAFGALAYAGGHGVVLPAPFGWIVDATPIDEVVATLYQRGLTLAQAQDKREWMYVNFFIKDDSTKTLEDLIKLQEDRMRKALPEGEFTYKDGPKRNFGNSRIRHFIENSYPAHEYTGFVEFENFIFFCVLFTPPELANRNLRKLNSILKSLVPFKMESYEN